MRGTRAGELLTECYDYYSYYLGIADRKVAFYGTSWGAYEPELILTTGSY